MKLYTLALLSVVLMWSCKPAAPENPPTENNIHLSGVISNPTAEVVMLVGANDFKLEAPLDSTGTFHLEFNAEESGYYRFFHGGERSEVYLMPGFDLSLTLNTEEFDETITFTGEGAGYNNYLAGLYLLNEELDAAHPWDARYLNDAETFSNLMDSMKTVRTDFVKMSGLKHKLDEDFVNEQALSFGYEKYILLSDYERGAIYYQEIDEVEIPEDFLACANELPIDNESMLTNSIYDRYVDVRLGLDAHEAMEAEDYDKGGLPEDLVFSSAKLASANKLLTAEKVKNHFFHAIMMNAIRYFGVNDLTALEAQFKALCTDQKCITAVEEEIAAWKPLWEGNPAPTFAYESITGETVSLESLKGKVVYVDVWATWCGPCKAEIPHLKDLEADMHGQNIAFVSVSVDEDKEAWQTMVAEKSLGGIQLFSDKAWESSICVDYKITGIPRFILIDQAGNIVSADAPRPSASEELMSLIEATLYGDDVAMN
jgi:thiol-disulfide isomerase/thioredoxin